MLKANAKGFTLAELLIALAILGVIATFTIPKIIGSASNGQSTAVAKEAASMVSGAFSVYTLNNSLTAGTTAGVLTQYMNFVNVDTTSATGTNNNFTGGCTATLPCLRLHNGGIMKFSLTQTFGATPATAAVYYNIDPDGGGPILPATFVQYFNGRLTTYGQATPVPSSSGTNPPETYATDPTYIQNWN